MRQVTENLGLDLGGITDEPSLIPNQVTNMIKIDEAVGQGGKDDVARAAAAAAQADADQAQADATAAAALAHQAIAAGIKVKQLSETEMKSICAFPESATGEPGIGSIISTNNQHFRKGYVVNLTARLKLVAICTELIMSNMSTYMNSEVYVRRNYAYPYMRAVMPIFVNQYATTGSFPIGIRYNTSNNTYGITMTPSSTTPESIQSNFIYNFIAMVEYTSDTDLGTDIE